MDFYKYISPYKGILYLAVWDEMNVTAEYGLESYYYKPSTYILQEVYTSGRGVQNLLEELDLSIKQGAAYEVCDLEILVVLGETHDELKEYIEVVLRTRREWDECSRGN